MNAYQFNLKTITSTRRIINVIMLLMIVVSTNKMVSQNVGIGTTNPAAKLDVNSPSTFISRFNSSTNQGFITVAENGIARAYIGSYAGAAEDVDFGTTASNLPGKLHLTIQSNPKLTIDNSGNVGVGTISPTEKLEVSGNLKMAGEIKPSGAAGLAGQVLTSNGNGTMQWAQAQTQNGTEIVDGNGTWGDCSVNNIEAHYPVGNANGAPYDYFGYSVGLSGDYAIIGAYNDYENGFTYTGSATILKRNNSTGEWESQGKLLNPNAADSDQFGWSVAISGDYAIVGAWNDSEGGIFYTGSATIFKRNSNSGVWESQGKFLNPSAANDDGFGLSVAISGDYAIIGAPYDDEGGLNQNGSATIFKRNASNGIWESQGKLVNPNAANNDEFGRAVAISGDYAIVGAALDDESGINACGSATIFKRNSTTGAWESQGKLLNPTVLGDGDLFGSAVSISGDYAIIGALLDDENGFTDNGSASIFKRNSTTGIWESQTRLTNTNGANADSFGRSVSISGDYVIIGASTDDENFSDNGSVSIYKRYQNVWRLIQKFTDPIGADGNLFGISTCVDASSRRFIVGEIGTQTFTGMAFFGKIK